MAIPADVVEYMDHADMLRATLEIRSDAALPLTDIGQGEYNANYLFVHPQSARRLVLRVNHGSQMHLDRQIAYEYHALELLAQTGRTPLPLYFDDSPQAPGHGILVETFLPGRTLDYREDIEEAARILADIHSITFSSGDVCPLVSPPDTIGAMLDESRAMYRVYAESDLADMRVCRRIDSLIDKVERAHDESRRELDGNRVRHLINTELNSTNFLICSGKPGFLVDWEKPIAGDVEQDLADFVAPTTTFWKTDVIYDSSDIEAFLTTYREAVAGRFPLEDIERRLSWYLPAMCLRGIAWCSMAYVEYADPTRPLRNESTAKKIAGYLSDDFLDLVCSRFPDVG